MLAEVWHAQEVPNVSQFQEPPGRLSGPPNQVAGGNLEFFLHEWADGRVTVSRQRGPVPDTGELVRVIRLAAADPSNLTVKAPCAYTNREREIKGGQSTRRDHQSSMEHETERQGSTQTVKQQAESSQQHLSRPIAVNRLQHVHFQTSAPHSLDGGGRGHAAGENERVACAPGTTAGSMGRDCSWGQARGLVQLLLAASLSPGPHRHPGGSVQFDPGGVRDHPSGTPAALSAGAPAALTAGSGSHRAGGNLAARRAGW